MKKIRLGILGAGRIVARVMADMHRLKHVEITAIAARDLSRAQETAERYHIPHAYGSCLTLAQSPEVDLVYIATPHPFHAEQTMLMMRHGKHVICEKPMAISHHEGQQMIDCAKGNGVFLMEVMWTRFLPCVQELVRMIREGVIGEVRNISANSAGSAGRLTRLTAFRSGAGRRCAAGSGHISADAEYAAVGQ
ncbi:MAG: Gfo/Idh/MocA family oxidoreductase [Clostridia bacterium]|nr:Gfo/Idh/MocA family oxidoreductase [Clostridia bacterium]